MRRLSIATAPRRNSLHWNQSEISWEEVCAWAESPADHKESGNYILGVLQERSTVVHKKGEEPCTNTHRRKDYIVLRSGITLDVDSPRADFADKVRLLFPYAALLHTTYSSAPDSPRYRLIIPTDRDMAPDEYIQACQAIMVQLGADQFDPGTSQPERYMFRPAAAQPEWFESWVLDGEPAVVDALLQEFDEDLSAKPIPRPHRNKRNPFELEGAVGAFNRVYADWDDLIKSYDLPYERIGDDRYQLVGARSQAGMGPVPDAEGLVYSHHANDPAFDRACSAFDLVRLHWFADRDEDANPSTPIHKLPSHAAMLEVASEDPRVVAEMVGAEFDEEMDAVIEEDEWKTRLSTAPRSGRVLDTVSNWDLVRANDPLFKALQWNEMARVVETTADLPWRKAPAGLQELDAADMMEFRHYLERVYHVRLPREMVDSLVVPTARQRPFHPIRSYLDALEWDGVSRLETCLPGVEPTPYTRLVARKVMVAAVARVLDPGCKWDHTLVLHGSEGLGKTWWINRVSRGYSSSLGRINSQDTLLTMQRNWIMVSDEGHSLQKSDAEEQKEFLTRTEDMFRAPYDPRPIRYPRRCVIWSTTNDETFLQRQQGNRRFLIVKCERRADFSISDHYVDQLWAEAVHLFRQGELLFFADDETPGLAEAREPFIEEDAIAGVIEEYVNRPVPEDWESRSIESRLAWLESYAHNFESDGPGTIDRTCSTQIWVEAMGRRIGDHRRSDLLAISKSLRALGWIPLSGRHRLPGYGPQQVFVRGDVL